MWYKNKEGNSYFIGSAITVERVSPGWLTFDKDAILVTRINAKTTDTALIEFLKTTDTEKFIEWLIDMIHLEKWKVSWDDFLEYKAKVLSDGTKTEEKKDM